MSENISDGSGRPAERQPVHMPDETMFSVLGEAVIAGAEQLTRSTANGAPGDRPSALQSMDGHVTMLQIRAIAAEIQKGGQSDGRI